MKNRTLDNFVVILAVVIALSFIITFFTYTSTHTISDRNIDWFHSAGFIGGTVGTLLSAVGIYFALQSLRESQRIHEQNSQLQVKIAEHMHFSLPSIKLFANTNTVSCKIVNVGNYPLLVNELSFTKDNVEFLDTATLFESVGIKTTSEMLVDFFSESKFELAPSESINLFTLSTNALFRTPDLRRVSHQLADNDLKISYYHGINSDLKDYTKSLEYFKTRI